MTHRRATGLLPPVPGPKLGPFDTGNEALDLKFLKRLDPDGDSHIWKVRINGGIYLLKMFFFDILDCENDGLLTAWTENEYEYYRSPFYNECRAFGRLQEENSDISVKCYGYLILGRKYRRELEKLGYEDKDWLQIERTENKMQHRSGMNYHRAATLLKKEFMSRNDQPIRAIVKEFLPGKNVVTPKMIPRMIRDMDTYHKLGIYVVDVEARNYMDGKMYDFSQAMTVPHAMLDEGFFTWGKRHIHAGDSTPWRDDALLDKIIKEVEKDSGTVIPHRMRPNFDYEDRLRCSTKASVAAYNRSYLYPRHRPEMYKWRGIVKGTSTALYKWGIKRGDFKSGKPGWLVCPKECYCYDMGRNKNITSLM